jgi:nucleosome binding factor SPN SPT16 subunit|tara:strand:+ start:664 stop:1053 length:390 start_codon:yes stop_codon:yes gene_type:complete
MTQVYVFVFIISLVGSVAYGGYYYYQDTQNKIKILTENTVKLEQAKQAQDKTIKTLVRDAKKFRKLNKDLNVKLQKAEGYKNKLIGKLRKHNLTRLSQQKPKLVEQKINRGTKKLLDSFKRITAVPAVE